MKTKLFMILSFTLLSIFGAGLSTATAQPYPNSGDQSVCLFSTEPYGVEYTATSTYEWTIIPGSGGSGTITNGVTGNLITVHWESTGTCTLQLVETNEAGCSVTVAITITVDVPPLLVITDPEPVCLPGTVDLTDPAVTAGSTLPSGTELTYWTDPEATMALTTPNVVAVPGTYYIKATTGIGCFVIEPVTVIINPLPATVTIFHN